MCKTLIRLGDGSLVEFILPCTTNADTLFTWASAAAGAQDGEIVAIAPCLSSLSSSVVSRSDQLRLSRRVA